MKLTKKQRSAVNSANASKSTGPTSEAGKARSSRNALKHGLRAQALALPNEDPTVVKARSDYWNGHYNPQSPAAQHLLNVCVEATLMSDRLHRYEYAALSKQIRDLTAEDTRHIRELELLLETKPARAFNQLRTFEAGCVWLIAQLEAFRPIIMEERALTEEEIVRLTRLVGQVPDFDGLIGCQKAWDIRFNGILAAADADTNPGSPVAILLRAVNLPPKHTGKYTVHIPTAEEAREWLLWDVEWYINNIRSVALKLYDPHTAADRADAAERHMILRDPTEARLFLRYSSETRNKFHRNLDQLMKVLAYDEAADRGEEEGSEVGSESAADGDSPNEANCDVTPEGVKASEPEPTPAVEGGLPPLDEDGEKFIKEFMEELDRSSAIWPSPYPPGPNVPFLPAR
jgi:hypothetical protein